MLKFKTLFRFSSSLEMNSYLANNLKKNELVPLKSCQAKVDEELLRHLSFSTRLNVFQSMKSMDLVRL